MLHSNSSNFSDIETQEINVVQVCLQKSSSSSDVSLERKDNIDNCNDLFNLVSLKLKDNKGGIICASFSLFIFGLIGFVIYEYSRKNVI